MKYLNKENQKIINVLQHRKDFYVSLYPEKARKALEQAYDSLSNCYNLYNISLLSTRLTPMKPMDPHTAAGITAVTMEVAGIFFSVLFLYLLFLQ